MEALGLLECTMPGSLGLVSLSPCLYLAGRRWVATPVHCFILGTWVDEYT